MFHLSAYCHQFSKTLSTGESVTAKTSFQNSDSVSLPEKRRPTSMLCSPSPPKVSVRSLFDADTEDEAEQENLKPENFPALSRKKVRIALTSSRPEKTKEVEANPKKPTFDKNGMVILEISLIG